MYSCTNIRMHLVKTRVILQYSLKLLVDQGIACVTKWIETT